MCLENKIFMGTLGGGREGRGRDECLCIEVFFFHAFLIPFAKEGVVTR